MAHDSFSFEILTPEHSFFADDVEAMIFTAADGEWEILKGHIPMIVALEPGVVKMKQNGVWRQALNSEGYMEVAAHGAVLFVQNCEWPEDVDRKQAERARQRAQEALRQSKSRADFRGNQAMLARAMAQLRYGKNRMKLD